MYIEIFFRPDFAQKIFQLALPPDFPPHNKKAAAMKIVNMFQNQVKLNGSDARIKMYGDIPFAGLQRDKAFFNEIMDFNK